MWQCELILEIVMCVMGMFYKQEFKRRNRRPACRRCAMEHELLFRFFMVKPFDLVENSLQCTGNSGTKRAQSEGSAVQ